MGDIEEDGLRSAHARVARARPGGGRLGAHGGAGERSPVLVCAVDTARPGACRHRGQHPGGRRGACASRSTRGRSRCLRSWRAVQGPVLVASCGAGEDGPLPAPGVVPLHGRLVQHGAPAALVLLVRDAPPARGGARLPRLRRRVPACAGGRGSHGGARGGGVLAMSLIGDSDLGGSVCARRVSLPRARARKGALPGLPWRRTRDPYAIWISEVMLQQTQTTRVDGRWQRWLARFPSVEALAAAGAADVLDEWQGMGYNRRALALHRAAREVAERGGELPRDARGPRGAAGDRAGNGGGHPLLCL